MIIPTTEWLTPTDFPDLRKHDEIAIDLETRDPDLKSKVGKVIIQLLMKQVQTWIVKKY
jgi:hypothetical protein